MAQFKLPGDQDLSLCNHVAVWRGDTELLADLARSARLPGEHFAARDATNGGDTQGRFDFPREGQPIASALPPQRGLPA